MDVVIFEDNVKYDPWIKILLALSFVLLIVLGILFYIDAHGSDIFPREPAAESRTGSVVLFISAVFLLVVYWLFLPRKVAVSQEGIIIRFSAFGWDIPFRTMFLQAAAINSLNMPIKPLPTGTIRILRKRQN
jgi:hypothetical protein